MKIPGVAYIRMKWMASFVEGDSHVTIAEKSMHDELLVTSAIYSSDEEEGNRDNSCRDHYDSDEELAAVTQHPHSSEANNNESVPPSPEASKRNGFQTG